MTEENGDETELNEIDDGLRSSSLGVVFGGGPVESAGVEAGDETHHHFARIDQGQTLGPLRVGRHRDVTVERLSLYPP